MYSTIMYTDATRNSRKEKLEWKIRRDTANRTCPVGCYFILFVPVSVLNIMLTCPHNVGPLTLHPTLYSKIGVCRGSYFCSKT